MKLIKCGDQAFDLEKVSCAQKRPDGVLLFFGNECPIMFSGQGAEVVWKLICHGSIDVTPEAYKTDWLQWLKLQYPPVPQKEGEEVNA